VVIFSLRPDACPAAISLSLRLFMFGVHACTTDCIELNTGSFISVGSDLIKAISFVLR